VTYNITAADRSAAKNQTRYPSTGTLSFVIGKVLLDNFEHGLDGNWAYGSWGLSNLYTFGNEKYSISDSPNGNYSPNTDNVLERLTPYDLSVYSKAELQFTLKKYVDLSDTLYVEASMDGTSWGVLAAINGIDGIGPPVRQYVRLNGFTGIGSQAVQVRFRMHSDASVQAVGVYLDDIELYTDGLTSGIARNSAVFPTQYSLSQNYPNPFNPSTIIEYAVPKTSEVNLVLFDVLGRKVVSFNEGLRQPGVYHVTIDGSLLSTGIYYYKLTAGSFSGTKKMVLLK